MHNHSHSHAQHASPNSSLQNRRRLAVALGLTGFYMIAEAVGGWLTGSLALLADAGHMLTDVAALALTLAAMWFAARPATPRKTYGYHRLEIIAALLNGITLIAICLFVLYEAYERLFAPPIVQSAPMMLVAAGGLAVNLLSAWILSGGDKHNLNLRGAWLHVLTDALGSVAAILAGALMFWFGWYAADPISSAFISLVIVYAACNLIRESINVLLEGTPAHINLHHLETQILNTAGVAAVHDLHVWTITSGRDALSAHVVQKPDYRAADILHELQHSISEQFGIAHLTIQIETNELANVANNCQTEPDCFKSKIQKSISNHA